MNTETLVQQIENLVEKAIGMKPSSYIITNFIEQIKDQFVMEMDSKYNKLEIMIPNHKAIDFRYEKDFDVIKSKIKEQYINLTYEDKLRQAVKNLILVGKFRDLTNEERQQREKENPNDRRVRIHQFRKRDNFLKIQWGSYYDRIGTWGDLKFLFDYCGLEHITSVPDLIKMGHLGAPDEYNDENVSINVFKNGHVQFVLLNGSFKRLHDVIDKYETILFEWI